MKRFILLITCFTFFAFFESKAQPQFKVEKVKFIETVDKRYLSYLPRVKSLSTDSSSIQVAEKINVFILDRFDIESFNQEELEEFRWYEVAFVSDIKKDILYIKFSGEFYGPYPSRVEEELFFDINNGEELQNKDISFHSLFTTTGYLDFMDKYWLAKAKKMFLEAEKCADSKPYCTYYDIGKYFIKENKLSVYLTNDCFSRVARACTPDLMIDVAVDSIKGYLSEKGRKILLEDSYKKKEGIEKFLYNRKVQKTLENNVFLFGKIENKYPFSMALSFQDTSNEVTGYYFYNRRQEKLQLKGFREGRSMVVLDEYVNDEKTGSFALNYTAKFRRYTFSIYRSIHEDIHLSGVWHNEDGTKEYVVKFDEVKMNDYP